LNQINEAVSCYLSILQAQDLQPICVDLILFYFANNLGHRENSFILDEQSAAKVYLFQQAIEVDPGQSGVPLFPQSQPPYIQTKVLNFST